MIANKIFTTLKDAMPSLTSNGITRVYPVSVPDNTQIDEAIVYNILNVSNRFNMTSAQVQLTIAASTYTRAHEIAQQVAGIFNNKRYSAPGDLLTTNFDGVVELERDKESGLYLLAVTVNVKTQQYMPAIV
jgi:hypothetical protein